MIIQHGRESMSLIITGYEFPDYKTSEKIKGNDTDANWLNLMFTYFDGKSERVYNESCLLANELSELIQNTQEIIKGKESLYISDFLEPYLKIVIAQSDDKILIGIEYVYDANEGIWKSYRVAEAVTAEKALQIIDELQAFYDKYPMR